MSSLAKTASIRDGCAVSTTQKSKQSPRVMQNIEACDFSRNSFASCSIYVNTGFSEEDEMESLQLDHSSGMNCFDTPELQS